MAAMAAGTRLVRPRGGAEGDGGGEEGHPEEAERGGCGGATVRGWCRRCNDRGRCQWHAGWGGEGGLECGVRGKEKE